MLSHLSENANHSVSVLACYMSSFTLIFLCLNTCIAFSVRCLLDLPVIYEQIQPEDAFGKMMLRNLEASSAVTTLQLPYHRCHVPVDPPRAPSGTHERATCPMNKVLYPQPCQIWRASCGRFRAGEMAFYSKSHMAGEVSMASCIVPGEACMVTIVIPGEVSVVRVTLRLRLGFGEC